MTEPAILDAYGVLTEPATLTIRRLLPGSVERVWAYLAEGELRRRWLAAGHMEMRVGAPFELVWRNDELSDPPGRRPPGFGAEHRMRSRVTELDPPRRLAIAWGDGGDVSFELEPRGDEVLLTVVHRRLPDRATLLKVAAGWHAHLDILVARATGGAPAPFWDGWSRLRQDHDRRLPAWRNPTGASSAPTGGAPAVQRRKREPGTPAIPHRSVSRRLRTRAARP